MGAGFASWVFLKVMRGKFGEIHWLMWAVTIGFVIDFAADWIQTFIH